MQMYDSLSEDYDRFVNWPNRLAFEMPFLETQLRSAAPVGRPMRVLDAACSTGMHAIELTRRGYAVSGADISAGMIARAIANAHEASLHVDFQTAGFGELKSRFSEVDALLCLGNSLPHLLTDADLEKALDDFGACLRPGGLLLIQNRNFDAVLARGERWMPPETHQTGSQDWIFLRFYDFDPDNLLTFHVVMLTRQKGQNWQQKIDSTRLYPQQKNELVSALIAAGFSQITAYGSMSDIPFDPQSSGNLVLAARWMPGSTMMV